MLGKLPAADFWARSPMLAGAHGSKVTVLLDARSLCPHKQALVLKGSPSLAGFGWQGRTKDLGRARAGTCRALPKVFTELQARDWAMSFSERSLRKLKRVGPSLD